MLGRIHAPLRMLTRSFNIRLPVSYNMHWRSLSSIPIGHLAPTQAKIDLPKSLPKRLGEDARKIMHYCAYLDADMIPIELLKVIMPEPERLYYALHELSQTQILRKEEQFGLYSFDKKLQESLKNNEQQLAIIATLIKHIVKIPPGQNMPKSLVASAKAIADAAMAARAFSLNLEQLCNMLGDYYSDAQQPNDALIYYERSLKMIKGRVKTNHLSVVEALNTVGVAHQALGERVNLQASLRYFDEAYKMLQAMGRGDHPASLNTLNNLGAAYDVLGGADNIQKAIECHEKVLEKRMVLFTGNHPAIARSLSNLGTSYMKLGGEEDVRKGIRYLEEALCMFKALYPYNHCDLASLLGNLGAAYEDLGDEVEALEYNKQSYDMWLALGESHSDTKLTEQCVLKLQPDHSSCKGFVQKLQEERDALGVNPVATDSINLH